uniref:Uncharacterized protein n=1 Tax=Pyxicephalus adspersus TaxID=30357 RepID=A0AAV3AR32_PYXAD|nr:TPA: hypothetical protein GDO54_009384 [Pyxicephalus adspersus]
MRKMTLLMGNWLLHNVQVSFFLFFLFFYHEYIQKSLDKRSDMANRLAICNLRLKTLINKAESNVQSAVDQRNQQAINSLFCTN